MTAPVLPLTLSDGVTSASSIRALTTVTTNSGTSFVLGTEVTIDASTSADANGLYLFFPNARGTSAPSDAILNIEIDGVVAWSVSLGARELGRVEILPGFIPAGSLLTAQAYGAAKNQDCSFTASLLTAADGQKFGAPVNLTTTNHVPGTSAKGVPLTDISSEDTKSAWTTLVASTPADLCALAIQLGPNGDANYSPGSALLDIGIGAGGAESVLFGDLPFSVDSAETLIPYGPMTFSVDLPAGTRIAGRYQASTTTLDSPDVNLIGVERP